MPITSLISRVCLGRMTRRAVAAVVAAAAFGSAHADTFTLRIASGHAPGFHFVDLSREYFVPELKKRVAAQTSHKLNVLEAYGGTVAKPAEVLDATQSGIVDMGLFCLCHVGGKLRAQNFPYFLPFGPSDPAAALRATRRVYDETPELNQQLERDFNQRLLALIPFDPYDLISTKPINSVADLKGRKVGGAGPNLPWVEKLGATPVSTTGPGVYTSMQSGVYEAVLAFASIMDAQKLYDVAPYYTQAGLGSTTVLALHINLNSLRKLPPEVQTIIVDTARDFERRAGDYTREIYIGKLRLIGTKGAKVSELRADQRAVWADALKGFPNEKAKELDRAGMPGSQIMRRFITAAEAEGHKWPVRYVIE